jgi:hypothetical protein
VPRSEDPLAKQCGCPLYFSLPKTQNAGGTRLPQKQNPGGAVGEGTPHAEPNPPPSPNSQPTQPLPSPLLRGSQPNKSPSGPCRTHRRCRTPIIRMIGFIHWWWGHRCSQWYGQRCGQRFGQRCRQRWHLWCRGGSSLTTPLGGLRTPHGGLHLRNDAKSSLPANRPQPK